MIRFLLGALVGAAAVYLYAILISYTREQTITRTDGGYVITLGAGNDLPTQFQTVGPTTVH